MIRNTYILKAFISVLFVALFTENAWADTATLVCPTTDKLSTWSDSKGIVTITDAAEKGGIQKGSVTIQGSTCMKLSGSRQFYLTYSSEVDIESVYLYAITNNTETAATVGTSSKDKTSYGTLNLKGDAETEITLTGVSGEGLYFTQQSNAVIVVTYTAKTSGIVWRESSVTKKNITDYKGQTIDVTIGRTLYKNDNYNTICLPFSLTKAQLDTNVLKGCTIMQFNSATVKNAGADNQTLSLDLTEVTSIDAGKPYLIKWASGDDLVNPKFYGVTISTDEGTEAGTGNITFQGTLIPSELETAGDKEYMFCRKNGFMYWPETSGTIKGFRCYFKL